MEQTRQPWIFVIREELLPGKFSIQPVIPSMDALMERDPKGKILSVSYLAVLTASAEYEAYKEEGWIKEHDVEIYARWVADKLRMALNEQVFVIPEEEFYKRVARGEFEGVRTPTVEERLRMGVAFHEVLSSVLDDYYRGISGDRQDNLLLRMRPHDVDGLKKLWGFCALYDSENGGLRWRYIGKPEVFKVLRRTAPLPSYWRSRPRRSRSERAA